jgi:hypothetical protein
MEIFQLSDPRQESIYRRLFLIGPGPAHFFHDTCRILDTKPLFDTVTHLAAHLMRETESAVQAVLTTIADSAAPDSENEKKKNMQRRSGQYVEPLKLMKKNPSLKRGFASPKRTLA